MSDNEFSEEEKDYETNYRSRITQFILLCVDISHAKKASNFLYFFSDVLKNLYQSPFKKPKLGILFVGGKNDSVKMVFDPFKDFKMECEQFIKQAGNVQEGSFIFPLKETLTYASKFLLDNKSLHENRQIVLLTDTVEPKLSSVDEDISSWVCIRDIQLAEIKFIIAPLSDIDLTTSDVYEELAKSIKKFEVNDSNRVILQILTNSSKSEINFYYHEHNYITFYNNNLFSDKYQSRKPKTTKNKNEFEINIEDEDISKVLNTNNEYIIGDSGKCFSQTIHLTKDEIQFLNNLAIPAGRKRGSLELLYVSTNALPLPLPNESQGKFLTPKSDDPASVSFASHMWEYCHVNDKILICSVITKKSNKAYLRPSMFQGEFGFIMQTMGYQEDFNLIDSKEFMPTKSGANYKKTMHQIINALKTDKSPLSIRDPKSTHYNALVQAKKAGLPLTNTTIEDESSKHYHDVQSKVTGFVDEFIFLTMQDVLDTEPVKKRVGKEFSRGGKRGRKAF